MAIRDAITNLTERYDRMTVRQRFDQVETAGVVDEHAWKLEQVAEREEREGLLALMRGFDPAPEGD